MGGFTDRKQGHPGGCLTFVHRSKLFSYSKIKHFKRSINTPSSPSYRNPLHPAATSRHDVGEQYQQHDKNFSQKDREGKKTEGEKKE